MRTALLVFFVAACGDGDPGVVDEPVELSVTITGLDTRVSGNGIECGVSPACDGSRSETCTLSFDPGTRISLQVTHPVCATTGGIYFTFGLSAPCEATTGRACMFDLIADTTITVTGVSAAQ